MKNFVIKKIPKKIKIETISNAGFKYKIKLSNLNIFELNIISTDIIDKLIITSFNRKYKQILLLLMDSTEDTSSGYLIKALDEVTRLKSILLKKYETIISKEALKKLLKKLKILEKEINYKIMEVSLINNHVQVHTKDEIAKSR